MDRIVRFSTDITAADVERRTIVGTVVPYGAIGIKVWIYKGDSLENSKKEAK